ncbi:MAG: DUF975 family protein, partial [Treponema sp.]|jgi:uncharacterized membrane protein|nr:DUF975 family protein [Treponema sp.]
MKMNSELRAQARAQLRGGWLPAVGITFLFCILVSVAAGIALLPLLIIGGPLCLGYYSYFLRKARGEEAVIENLFHGFNDFGRSFVLFLLELVLITLWSLLLVIPGIIKTLSYSMAFFILKDNPGMSSLDAITASRKMMKGHKGKLFCLCFSFIGWCLLCALTGGIGYFWLGPYMQLSMANFYEDIKNGDSVEFRVIGE